MQVGLVKTSLVNYPGRVCAAVFLPGCNLRCPFCHNAALATASLVSGPRSDDDGDGYVTLEEALSHLDRRAKVLGAVAISGGEPLLSPALPAVIAKARSLGLAVKIDTNGTLPDRLRSILNDPDLCPDMIACDFKTVPERYPELCIGGAEFATSAIRESLQILGSLPAGSVKPRIEYRTVLVPGLVGADEIRAMSALLPRDADWQLASFVPGCCLDPQWDSLAPYGPAETQNLVHVARERVPAAQLR